MASIEETQGLLGGIKAVPSSSIALDESEADAGVWLVRAAARALSDGLSGRKVRPPPARTPKALRAHLFRLKHQPVAWAASIALIVLAFYEPPYWCETCEKCTEAWATHPTMHVSYVGEAGAVLWTLLCLLPLSLDEGLRVRANGKKNNCGGVCVDWSVKGLVVPLLVLFTLGCVVGNATLPTALVTALRLRPAAQLARSSFVLLHDRELQAQFGVIAKLLPRFLRFLVLLLFVGFFYSLFGMSIFPENTTLEGQDYFSDIGESLWNFELLLTSNILPGAILDAWKVNQTSVLYILGAIVVAYFYFLNLVLAVVYDGYLEQKKEFLLATQLNYAGNLEIAYGLLEQCSASHHGADSSGAAPYQHTSGTMIHGGVSSSPTSTSKGSSDGGGGGGGVDNARVRLVLEELEKLSCFDVYSLRRRRPHSSSLSALSSLASGDDDSDSLVWNFLERQDPSAALDRVAFARVCRLTQMQFKKRKGGDDDHPFMETWLPEVYESKCFEGLKTCVKSKTFANLFACILVINTGLLLLEVQGEPLYDRTVLITTCFVLVYGLELVLVLLVRGWAWYWKRSLRRRIELVTLLCTAVLLPLVILTEEGHDSGHGYSIDDGGDEGSAYSYGGGDESNSVDAFDASSALTTPLNSTPLNSASSFESSSSGDGGSTVLGVGRVRLLRFLLVMRCTPTIRLLGCVGDYTTFAKVTMALLPRAYEMGKVLVAVMYGFSVCGMLLFAGLISWEDPALDGTAYLEQGFESLNFNDMGSSMLVMTQVLVVNQFDTVVGGFVAVTSKWARLYFTFFYLLGVLLILNIVIAVMLDSFITSMHHQTVLATNQARQSHVDSKDGGGGGGDDDSAVDSSNNNCSVVGGGDVEGGGHDAAAVERARDRRCTECFSGASNKLCCRSSGGEEGSPSAVSGPLVSEACVEDMRSAILVAAGNQGGDEGSGVEGDGGGDVTGGGLFEGSVYGLEGLQYEPSSNLAMLRSGLVAEALLPHTLQSEARARGLFAPSSSSSGSSSGSSSSSSGGRPHPTGTTTRASSYGSTPAASPTLVQEAGGELPLQQKSSEQVGEKGDML